MPTLDRAFLWPVRVQKLDFGQHLQRIRTIRSGDFLSRDSLAEQNFLFGQMRGFQGKSSETRREDSLAERGGFEPPIELLTL
jgi:hypothetical protein